MLLALLGNPGWSPPALGFTRLAFRKNSDISHFNSLAPGRPECDSENVIFNLVLLIGIFRSSHDNALRRMPWDLTDDKSRLVQVMAWCCQATSHYLGQCWLSSLSSYGVTRPQWVNPQLHLLKTECYNLMIFHAGNATSLLRLVYQILSSFCSSDCHKIYWPQTVLDHFWQTSQFHL